MYCINLYYPTLKKKNDLASYDSYSITILPQEYIQKPTKMYYCHMKKIYWYWPFSFAFVGYCQYLGMFTNHPRIHLDHVINIIIQSWMTMTWYRLTTMRNPPNLRCWFLRPQIGRWQHSWNHLPAWRTLDDFSQVLRHGLHQFAAFLLFHHFTNKTNRVFHQQKNLGFKHVSTVSPMNNLVEPLQSFQRDHVFISSTSEDQQRVPDTLWSIGIVDLPSYKMVDLSIVM